jgi:hypothetical protein
MTYTLQFIRSTGYHGITYKAGQIPPWQFDELDAVNLIKGGDAVEVTVEGIALDNVTGGNVFTFAAPDAANANPTVEQNAAPESDTRDNARYVCDVCGKDTFKSSAARGAHKAKAHGNA